jgi:hypothetical protein
MRGGDFDVFNRPASVALVVLDANVGELDVTVEERELVVAGPRPDLLWAAIGTSAAVTTASVRLLEKSLILPLQLFFQDDSPYSSPTSLESVHGLRIRAIHIHVVGELTRFRDTAVEALGRLALPLTPSAF